MILSVCVCFLQTLVDSVVILSVCVCSADAGDSVVILSVCVCSADAGEFCGDSLCMCLFCCRRG